jgi:hypothetical protein
MRYACSSVPESSTITDTAARDATRILYINSGRPCAALTVDDPWRRSHGNLVVRQRQAAPGIPFTPRCIARPDVSAVMHASAMVDVPHDGWRSSSRSTRRGATGRHSADGFASLREYKPMGERLRRHAWARSRGLALRTASSSWALTSSMLRACRYVEENAYRRMAMQIGEPYVFSEAGSGLPGKAVVSSLFKRPGITTGRSYLISREEHEDGFCGSNRLCVLVASAAPTWRRNSGVTPVRGRTRPSRRAAPGGAACQGRRRWLPRAARGRGVSVPGGT